MAAAAALLDGALSHFRAKRTAEAKAAFDDALRVCAPRGGLDGDQLEMVHSMRGDCCAILGMQALAAEDFGRSIELAPDVAIYRYKRGMARRKLGEHAGAIADLRRSIEMGCGLGKAELQRLQAQQRAPAEPEPEPEPEPAVSPAARAGGKTRSKRSQRTGARRSQSEQPTRGSDRGGTSTARAAAVAEVGETAEAEAVRAQLAVVEREQQRLASLTARVVSVALTDGERERTGRLAAERAVEGEQQRVERARAKAQRERERAKVERRAAKRADAVAQASIVEAAEARAEAAGQRERVAQYLLCAQQEIATTEREASQRTAAVVEEGQRRDAAREEQAARQQAAATAVLRKERAARAAAAEAQAQAEGRLEQAEAELAAAQREAAAAAAAAASSAATGGGMGSSGGGGGGGGSGDCVICLDAPKEMLLEPCRHVCLCADCAARVTECPVCRSKVRRRMRLYL